MEISLSFVETSLSFVEKSLSSVETSLSSVETSLSSVETRLCLSTIGPTWIFLANVVLFSAARHVYPAGIIGASVIDYPTRVITIVRLSWFPLDKCGLVRKIYKQCSQCTTLSGNVSIDHCFVVEIVCRLF